VKTIKEINPWVPGHSFTLLRGILYKASYVHYDLFLSFVKTEKETNPWVPWPISLLVVTLISWNTEGPAELVLPKQQQRSKLFWGEGRTTEIVYSLLFMYLN